MIWDKIVWLLTTCLKFKRTAYPRSRWGFNLCRIAMIGIPFSFGVLKINFASGYVIDSLEITGQQASLYSILIEAILIMVGILLIYTEWSIKVRHTAKVLIASLPNSLNDFPDEILDPTEKEFCRESITLGLSQSNNENFKQQVKRYNAELEVDIFKRFILHSKGQRLYIGGLARTPFLIAYGAFLRNISSEVLYFDQIHANKQWSLLDGVNEQISFAETSLIETVNQNGDIALAVSLTTPIRKEHLPETLQSHTTILSPTVSHKKNLVGNQENLSKLSEEVGQRIEQLSALPNSRKVHLFLSVQSSFAIDLGRRFQEGIQKNWMIYNFNPSKSTYDWTLELSKEGVQLEYLSKPPDTFT